MLGFPCNQFGAQEPGSNAEIQQFAESKYNVNFPMFAKVDVNGEGAAALYQWLKSEQPEADGNTDIGWNFTKFLVNAKGQVVKRYGPQTTPEEIAESFSDYL